MQERARSFDAVAELYDEMRPRYPDALFDDLLETTGVAPGSRVLEIGTGPGVATRPLAERGLQIVGLEPGPALAATARANLAAFDTVEIRETTFEDAVLEPGSFDLIVSASAWHWVDPDSGLDIAARALRPGGSLAVWWGHGVIADPQLRADSEAIQDRRAPGITAQRASMQQVRRGTLREQIERHPAFGLLVEHSHPFELTYDSAGFVRLLDTYSHYRLLDEDTRQALFAELTDVVDTRYDGRVVRRYNSTLCMAARVPDPA